MVHKGDAVWRGRLAWFILALILQTVFFSVEKHTHWLLFYSSVHTTQSAWNKWDFQQESCNLFVFFFFKKKTFLKFKYGWFAMLCLFPVYSKEGWSCRNQAPWLQTIWQSYKSKHHATHTHARTHTHTQTPEIDTNGTGRKPRNKPMLLSLINLQQRRQRYNGEKTFSLISAGKTGQLHTKEWNQNIL